MNNFLPITSSEQKEMLATLGYASIDELLKDALNKDSNNSKFDLPSALSESEVYKKLLTLSNKNISSLETISLLGGGCYNHYIPAAVRHIASRSEFYTAYTPYQPEISQGTLQAIFEFQTMLCKITGCSIANASLYDGATALYEAAMMALRITKRNKIVMDGGVSPIYRKVIKTYINNNKFPISIYQ